MEFKDFFRSIWRDITFVFTLSIIALVLYAHYFGSNTVTLREITAVFILSILITLAGIVLCSSRSLKRVELFIRHVIRLFLVVGIVLFVATYEGWALWSEPNTIIPFLVIIVVLYSIGMATEYHESKKQIGKMNEKLKERNMS